MATLTLFDFAASFGTTVDLMPERCRERILACNWNYSLLTEQERDSVILDLLGRIESRKLTTVANEDKSRWEKGWGENLDAFNAMGGNLDALVPKYIRPGMPVRIGGKFARTEDPNFEYNWFALYRDWFFERHLGNFKHVFEFGSGSGFNVARLAQIHPHLTVHGVDWAAPSVEIVENLRKVHKYNTRGHQFDFFHPDYSLDIPEESALYTFGALEQTGTSWESLLDFILAKKPRYCFHFEPIYEWYDSLSSLEDYTAWKAHEVRNFWRGFPPRLIELEKAGRVRILNSKRTYFGSVVLEGYSQLFWQPL